MVRIANATTDPEEHVVIEVTPEMIEAGAAEVENRGLDFYYDPSLQSREEIACAIYLVMRRAFYGSCP